jgi:hypothetical protein
MDKNLVSGFMLVALCSLPALAQAQDTNKYGVFTTDNPMPYCDLISSRPVNILSYKTGTKENHKLIAKFIMEKKNKLMTDAYKKGNAVVGYRSSIGVTQNGVTVSMDGVSVQYDCTKHNQKLKNKG